MPQSEGFSPIPGEQTRRSGASIIIPAGRPNIRQALLDALDHFVATQQVDEIIWVSPQPVDTISGREKYQNVVTGKLLPPGGMRNRGAEAACGEILLFIDDDCVPPLFWAQDMCKALRALPKDIGAMGCAYPSAHPGFWAKCADHALFSDCVATKSRCRPVGSGAMAVLSQAFHEVGGFDEILLASEDFEFGLKLAQAGWSVQYNSAIQVAHYHHRMSCKEILGSAFASGYRSGLVVQRRYPDKVSWLARLSLRMSHPFFYLVLIFPYALLVSVNHIGEEMRRHPIAWIYTPACVVGRLAYQSGVWFRLLQDRRAGRKKNGDVRQRG